MSNALLLFFVSFLAAVSPGPDFVVVVRRALISPREIACWTVIGVGTALLIHLTYVLFGLSLVVGRSQLLFNCIKYLGAAYLLYLGGKTFWSSFSKQESLEGKGDQEVSALRAFREGFLTNLLNPKVAIFLTSLFAQLLSEQSSFSTKIQFGAINWGVTTLWFFALMLLVSHDFLQRHLTRIRLHLERVMGVVLMGIALKICFS